MPLSSRDIVRQFAQLHGLMEDQLNEFLSMLRSGVGVSQEWRPAMDVFETDDMMIIRMEIAGVPKESLSIELHGNTLVINGKRSDQWNRQGRAFRQMEIQYGTFCRRLPVDESCEADRIEAQYKDGMLEIKVPRVSATEIRHEPVRVIVQGND